MATLPQKNPNDTPEQADYRSALRCRFTVIRRFDPYEKVHYWAFMDTCDEADERRWEERSAHDDYDEAWESICDEIDTLVASLEPAEVSYAAYIRAHGETSFNTNGLRFATREEADGYARELMSRWFGAAEYSVRETPDPVNHRWDASTWTLHRID